MVDVLSIYSNGISISDNKIGVIDLDGLIHLAPEYSFTQTALAIYKQKLHNQIDEVSAKIETLNREGLLFEEMPENGINKNKQLVHQEGIKKLIQTLQLRKAEAEVTIREYRKALANVLKKKVLEDARLIAIELGFNYLLESNSKENTFIYPSPENITTEVLPFLEELYSRTRRTVRFKAWVAETNQLHQDRFAL